MNTTRCSFLGSILGVVMMVGCGGSETASGTGGEAGAMNTGGSTTSTGGAGGDGGAGGSIGGTGGTSGETGGSTGTTTSTYVDPDGEQLVNGLPATLETVQANDCAIFTPTDGEDHSYLRVNFGPFWEPWTSFSLRFVAYQDDNHMIPKSWWLAWIKVPVGEDPASYPCSIVGADLKQLDSVPFQTGTAVLLEAANFGPADYEPGQTLVACLRNDVDVLGFGQSTGILMCGEPGSCTKEADQIGIGGKVDPLSEHRPPAECRHVMAQYIPQP